MAENNDWREILPSDRFLGIPDDRSPDEEGEFDAETVLYIRTNPSDTGAESLEAGLDFWLSPDIRIRKPDGTLGIEATAGVVNKIEVTVHNDGDITATDAYVEIFLIQAAAAINLASISWKTGGYLVVPADGNAMIAFDWIPPVNEEPHRCLIARVSSVVPFDTYTDPTIFDVTGDRHVAQRNIHVVTVGAGQRSRQFRFQFANTLPGLARFQLQVLNTPQAMRMTVLQEAFGAEASQIKVHPVQNPVIRIDAPNMATQSAAQVRAQGCLSMLSDIVQILFGNEPTSKQGVEMQPDEIRGATLTISRQANMQAGDANVVNVLQVDTTTGETIGGYTLIIRFD